jgi:hypothetical protein
MRGGTSRNFGPNPGTQHVGSPYDDPFSRSSRAIAAFFLGLPCHHRLSPVRLGVLLTAYGALLELGQLWVPADTGSSRTLGLILAARRLA